MHTRKVKGDAKQAKFDRLQEANNKLLSQSWHNSPSLRPFVEIIIKFIEQNKLSDFDHIFLQNWLKKKLKGHYCNADEQASKLAILYSNQLGEKMYTSTTPLFGLSSARHTHRNQSNDIGDSFFLPGFNWALEKVSQQEHRPLQNGMDGTRIIQVVELYRDQGKAIPPDVRLFPSPEQMHASNYQQIQDHILQVRSQGAYAAEAYSFNLSDTTGKLPDILTGSIPESKSGVTGGHIPALMLEFERRCSKYSLPPIAHCTDSAANALLLYFAWADQRRRLFCIDHRVQRAHALALIPIIIRIHYISACWHKSMYYCFPDLKIDEYRISSNSTCMSNSIRPRIGLPL